MIFSWIDALTEPMSTLFCRISLPPFSLCASELTITSHLQTPASLNTVRVIFNCTTSGPLSRLYLALSTTIVPSGAVQVMVAWGLLSRPVPQTREALPPNNAEEYVGPSVMNAGGSATV